MVSSAANHMVVGELLAWKIVGEAWGSGGLRVADELVAVGCDGRHDASAGGGDRRAVTTKEHDDEEG